MIKISVIIPSYNQGQFLEACLQSILCQKDGEIEILVFDGGSQDDSVHILKKYQDCITHWESEPDRGQTHAINKGLERMTGDVWCYLNSDDLMEEGALSLVAKVFEEGSVNWVVGQTIEFCDRSIKNKRYPNLPVSNRDYLPYWGKDRGCISFSCSCTHFFRRNVVERVGYLREDLHYTMDMEFFARLGLFGQYKPTEIDQVLARWRFHENSKTFQKGIAYAFIEEELNWAKVYKDYLPDAVKKDFLGELKKESSYLPLRKVNHYLNRQELKTALKYWFITPLVAPVNLFRRWWWSLGKSVFFKDFHFNVKPK